MGWIFALEQANLIAYLTTPTAKPPRVTRGLVNAALLGLIYGTEGMPGLISRDEAWVSAMKNRASEAEAQLGHPYWPDNETEVPPDALEALLRPLRQELSTYDVFGLLVDDQRSVARSEELRAFATQLAYSARGNALILMPINGLTRWFTSIVTRL